MIRHNPYVSFKDSAREAMEFYKSIFGGTLTMSTFSESMGSGGDGIMHAQLEGEHGVLIMGSDTPEGMTYQDGARISMSLSGDEESVLRNYWEKLSEGGVVAMNLEKAPWGDTFGMLVDKFGIQWMVNITGAKA